jgi:phenylacetate-CoA ligase
MSHHVPKTTLRGISWPGIPNRRNSLMLSALYQLDQSQWWDPERIKMAQYRQLQRLLQQAYHTVPLYRQRLERAEINPQRPLDDEQWSRLPLLSRQDLQQYDLRSSRVPPRHGRTYETQTSGSTGQPVKITGTEITLFFWRVFTLREHQWHQRDFSGKLASIRAPVESNEPVLSESWGSPVADIYDTGPAGSLGVKTDISKQVDWLREFAPDYLLTYPSNLLAIIEYCEEKDIRIPRLREARTISETVTEKVRAACARCWQVPLTDVYSSQEVGYITMQCPDYPDRMHVQSENVLVEILNEQGRPCSAGEIGNVIVSSLNNFATPLLRYALRDLAEAGEQCPCGRGLPVINRILGRERNMLVLPNGEKRWPLTGYRQYGEIAPAIGQFQFIQHSLQQVEVKLVVTRPLTNGEETTLISHIQSSLGYPFDITLSYHDSIPRSASGKFEEFISRIV